MPGNSQSRIATGYSRSATTFSIPMIGYAERLIPTFAAFLPRLGKGRESPLPQFQCKTFTVRTTVLKLDFG
jgi:hypothetical protein